MSIKYFIVLGPGIFFPNFDKFVSNTLNLVESLASLNMLSLVHIVTFQASENMWQRCDLVVT
jgi:hypothetical protein